MCRCVNNLQVKTWMGPQRARDVAKLKPQCRGIGRNGGAVAGPRPGCVSWLPEKRVVTTNG